MTQRYRIHTFGIPHLPTNRTYNSCAYTQRQVKFCKMMRARGHYIIFYGHADSEVDCDEFVVVSDNAVLDQAYQGYDWRNNQFRHNTGDHAYITFNDRCIPEIQQRVQPLDIVHCPFGFAHQRTAEAAEKLGAIIVEGGVGYTSGHFTRFRAYESHAVRNTVEGQINPQFWYSRVIPCYFDPDDFTYQTDKEDFVLFLGRITELKGISTCIRAAEAAGVRLKIAGQGNLAEAGWAQLPNNCEFVGYADIETRRDLMSRASAFLIASSYNEPFGGVQVESMLSGTPVISPFFGAFAEVNLHGITGFHCHTLRDYRDAILNRNSIDPAACRAQGMNYTLDRVAPMYERWFADITEIYTGNGWMAL
tara:strand:+ start:7393 stop:8481 length:1089 start_codon:yes stop_codon:yes gene_type:complete